MPLVIPVQTRGCHPRSGEDIRTNRVASAAAAVHNGERMSDAPPPAESLGPVVQAPCPHCGATHPVREQVLGRLARCTTCGQRFVLRQVEEGAEETAPPPTPSPAPPLAAPTGESPARAVAVPPPFVMAPEKTASASAPPTEQLEPPATAPPRSSSSPRAAQAPPQNAAWRDDHWGIASVVLAAFAFGFLLTTSPMLFPFVSGSVCAGLMSSLFAKRRTLRILALVLNLLLGLAVLTVLVNR